MATSSQDAITFARNLIATVNALITTMQQLNTFNDRMAQDPNLAASAATAMQAVGRPTLTTQNFVDVGSAITQVQFTLNSGAPTQYSKLYEIL